MAITIEKRVLLDLLQKAYPIIPVKSSLQILSNFKLSFADSRLEVTATDLDHSIKLVGNAEGDGPFEITVNARKAFEIVRELPDGKVRLDIDESVLIIEAQSGFTCKIAGADSHDFPGFPDVSDGNEFSISGLALREMIAKSSFAVAKDESRACLCGIHWEISDDKTGMVATDGHRLGSSFLTDSFPVKGNISGIISPKSVMNLVRILDSKDPQEKVTVMMGEKYVVFTTPSIVMCSKLIEGPYPDYTKVIPRNNPREAIVERQALQNAVRRVSVLSNQKTHLVKFTFSRNSLEIVVMNREIGGEARETIPVSYDGETHIIGFNGQYFSEILDIVNVPKVRLEMNTQISACLIYPHHEKEPAQKSNDLFLIMPLRILEEV